MAETTNSKIFLPVPGVKLGDLLDWQVADQRNHRRLIHSMSDCPVPKRPEGSGVSHLHRKCFGKTIDLNDKSIALFRIGGEVYATQSECPHAGGPLYLADIEELVPGHVSLKCPSHKWRFDIDTGRTLHPHGRDVKAETYPVRVDEDGNLFIGFHSLGPSAFRTSF